MGRRPKTKGKLMVLADITKNGTYHVHLVKAGGEMGRHLQDMGFLPGEPIQVVAHFDGIVVVSVKGSRVALSDELARDIIV